MHQIVINIEDDTKAKYFIDFLRQIDFIGIEKINILSTIKSEINESCNELQMGKVKSWKNKKINIKDA
jgi:hypothetical protein